MADSAAPWTLRRGRLPCPSLSPRVCSNSCPLSRWCHPTISSPVVPFSSLQSFLASRSFPTSRLFASGGQSIGVSASASVFPMKEMATHSSTLAWEIPWTEEPGGLQSMLLQRVGHDWVIHSHTCFIYLRSHSNSNKNKQKQTLKQNNNSVPLW